MMSPDGSAPMTGHDHGNMEGRSMPSSTNLSISENAKKALKPVYDQYLLLKDKLTQDDLIAAKEAAAKMDASLKQVNMALFTGESHNLWMGFDDNLKKPYKLLNLQNQ
ncbi:DUF3347 domain-containing protein [Algoriphagus halophilus]